MRVISVKDKDFSIKIRKEGREGLFIKASNGDDISVSLTVDRSEFIKKLKEELGR